MRFHPFITVRIDDNQLNCTKMPVAVARLFIKTGLHSDMRRANGGGKSVRNIITSCHMCTT